MVMAVTENPSELSGTLRWAIITAANFAIASVAFGVMFVAVSAPALFILSSVYPQAEPFAWLAVAGLTFGILSMDITDDEADALKSVIERASDMSRRERHVFTVSIFTILIGGISLQVAVISISAAILTSETSFYLVAVLLAMLYPSIDAKIGDAVGINIASFGALLMTQGMRGFAAVYRVSPSVPQAARHEVRSGFTR